MICIAIKRDDERCTNPAHEGFSTCGIKSHRKQEKQPGTQPSMTSKSKSLTHSPDDNDADEQLYGSEPQIQHISSDVARPESKIRPRPQPLGSSNDGRETPFSSDHTFSAKSLWEHLHTDVQRSLTLAVSDVRESTTQQSDSLLSDIHLRVDEGITKMQTTFVSQLHSSFSSLRDEQDKKERKITDQLNAFDHRIYALQQSFDALTSAHERFQTVLRSGDKELEQKVDTLLRNDQVLIRRLAETKSRFGPLSVAHQQSHTILQDGQEKLDKKIDAVLRHDQSVDHSLTETLEDSRTQISALAESHFEHTQSLGKDFAAMQIKISEVESLIRDFCAQMRGEQQGDEPTRSQKK